MEPDFDKLVSNKIRQAEQRLIPWNKQTVWQKVQSEKNAGRRFHYLYYSAAALILLLIYFGVQLIRNEGKPQVTEANIISAKRPTEQEATEQEANEQEKKTVIPERSPDQLPDETAHNLKNNTTVHDGDIPNSFREPTSLGQQKTKDVDAAHEPVVPDIEIEEKEFLLPLEVSVHEEKIRPIVGIITESDSEVANLKQKKRLHKLESPEPVPWENIPNALVFARKK